MKKQVTKASKAPTKKAAAKKTPAKAAAKKTVVKKAVKKSEDKIQYFALVSMSKKVGWLHFVFKETITKAELEAFNDHNLARRLKATAVIISKDIYDYWVSEEVHNSLEMSDLSSEPFGFLPNKDDGIYEEIVYLNPTFKIK